MSSTSKSKESFSNKVVCLVSGGIDSPVAAGLMMKKGCTPVLVYFDNAPFTDESTMKRAVEAVRKLKRLAHKDSFRLHVVPHGGDLADILRNCPRNLTCLLCRRMMYRLAERIALDEGAEALVTGEIMGEHASQTLTNLRVINEAVSQVSVFRPLVGMNKTEVEAMAREMGTFDASTKPASCCSGPPPKPRTRARFDEIRRAEEKLKIEDMIERDLKAASVIMV